MPELPEVETMVRGLRPALAGRIIESIDVHDPFLLQGCTAEDLAKHSRKASVEEVSRRGKWVVIRLAGHRGMIVIQPRMTGGFWLIPPAKPEHARLSFRLAKPHAIVWYCDARRLGKICWFATPEEAERAFAKSQGTDALLIGLDELSANLRKTGRAIKPALMDQKIVAGIGNIYADEILFATGLHPERVASTLTRAELRRLHKSITDVLTVAIAAEGSTFDAGYRTVLGLEGGFLAQNFLYGRAGQPCRRCGTVIQKLKIAGLTGRPTYLCSICQPVKSSR